MEPDFLDYVRARVVEGNQEKADAILAEHFAGHEAGLQEYKQAWDSAEQIWQLTTHGGQPEDIKQIHTAQSQPLKS